MDFKRKQWAWVTSAPDSTIIKKQGVDGGPLDVGKHCSCWQKDLISWLLSVFLELRSGTFALNFGLRSVTDEGRIISVALVRWNLSDYSDYYSMVWADKTNLNILFQSRRDFIVISVTSKDIMKRSSVPTGSWCNTEYNKYEIKPVINSRYFESKHFQCKLLRDEC